MQEETPPLPARSRKRWHKRRFLAMLLIVCLGGTLSLTSASLAFAATRQAAHPLCSGQQCNGKDLSTSLCAGQNGENWSVVLTTQVLSQENIPIGYVQLWYSATCKTNWTRLVIQVPHSWMQAVVGDDKWGDPVLRNTSTTTSQTTGVLLSPQVYAPVAGTGARGDAVPLSDGRITTVCIDQDNGHICSWLPL